MSVPDPVSTPAAADGELPAVALAAASLALARRFAAGATLWCWSPAWPQHAQHVAVEFVHPVIVGKRALPSEAVTAAAPVAALRTLMAPGDVLLALSDAAEGDVRSVMRRAPAWGVTTLWIGVGPRPPAGAADHVLWLERAERSAVHTGQLVLTYHLLWELTHVCFEHPGLLVPDEDACEGDVCITCSDEGRLGEVTEASGRVATVRTAQGLEQIDTTLVEPVHSGDLVLVHAGMAMERLAVDAPDAGYAAYGGDAGDAGHAGGPS